MITLLQLILTTTFILKLVQSADPVNLGQLNLVPGLAARYYKSTLTGAEDSITRRKYVIDKQFLTDGTMIAQSPITELAQTRIIYKHNKLFGFYYDPSYHDMIVEFSGYLKAPATGVPTFITKVNIALYCNSSRITQQLTDNWSIQTGLYLDETADGYLCTQNASAKMFSSSWLDAPAATDGVTIPKQLPYAYLIEGKIYPFYISLRVSRDAYSNQWSLKLNNVNYNLDDIVYYDPQDDFVANNAHLSSEFPDACPQFHDEKFVAETFVEPTSIVPDGCPVTSSSVIESSSATSDIESSTIFESSSDLPSSIVSSSEITSSIVSSIVTSSTVESTSEVPNTIVSSTVESSSAISSSEISSSIVSSTVDVTSELPSSVVSSSVIPSDIESSIEQVSSTVVSSIKSTSAESSAIVTSDVSSSVTSDSFESSSIIPSITSSVVSSQITSDVSSDISSSEYLQSSEVPSSIPPVVTSSSIESNDSSMNSVSSTIDTPSSSAYSPTFSSNGEDVTSTHEEEIPSQTDTSTETMGDVSTATHKTTTLIKPDTETFQATTLTQSEPKSSETDQTLMTTILTISGTSVTATIKTTVQDSKTVTYTDCPICSDVTMIPTSNPQITTKNDNEMDAIATDTKLLYVSSSSGVLAYNPQDTATTATTSATVLPFSDSAYTYTYEPLLLSLAFVLAFL
ncbi:hypothetical protein C6P45_000036 [Maudiozyma exigua]|uniref:Flo11 domain-containing protein n=1 Tax=Maudiozyma exigua TaxID=34358 RepID=A0A9P6WHR0_MAUEX|nr:hypothetical protein C6P45_000036 [Kazachstania exigua]